ncbi:MAG: isoprenylcysteine carboxylmethyltransferase family protein [Bacteroidota bacterium]
MNLRSIQYKYGLFASLAAVLIFVLLNILESGTNLNSKIIGVALLASSIILWIIPVFQLKKFGNVEKDVPYFNTNNVVEKGIYKCLRHPQYLAYMLLVLGFSFVSQHIVIIVLSVISIFLFYLHSIDEEKFLVHKFGSEYEQYCSKVPRFNIIKGVLNLFLTKHQQ